MRRPFFGFALATAVALAQGATVKPIASVRQIMQTMIVPFSDAIFSANSIVPVQVARATNAHPKVNSTAGASSPRRICRSSAGIAVSSCRSSPWRL
jgi:hypothetical protein